MDELHEWLRHGRKDRGLSQVALAREVGAQAHQVSQWERGTSSPTPEVMVRLKSLLGDPPATPEAAGTPPWWDEAVRLKDEMSLRDLAGHVGVSVGALSMHLKKAGVARRPSVAQGAVDDAPGAVAASADSPARRPGSKDNAIERHLHLLGMIPDAEVAKLAGVSVRTIASYRARNRIEGYRGPRRRPAPRGGRQSKLDNYRAMLGVVPDRVVAEEAAMSLGAVRNYRIKHNIPASGRKSHIEVAALRAQSSPAQPSTGLPAAHGDRRAWRLTVATEDGPISRVVLAADLVEVATIVTRASAGLGGAVTAIDLLGDLL